MEDKLSLIEQWKKDDVLVRNIEIITMLNLDKTPINQIAKYLKVSLKELKCQIKSSVELQYAFDPNNIELKAKWFNELLTIAHGYQKEPKYTTTKYKDKTGKEKVTQTRTDESSIKDPDTFIYLLAKFYGPQYLKDYENLSLRAKTKQDKETWSNVPNPIDQD